jgi:hypothetical protein
MKRPSTLAEVALRVKSGAPFGLALSEFLDEFYGNPQQRQTMIADEPERLTDTREHAMLGAVWRTSGAALESRRPCMDG